MREISLFSLYVLKRSSTPMKYLNASSNRAGSPLTISTVTGIPMMSLVCRMLAFCLGKRGSQRFRKRRACIRRPGNTIYVCTLRGDCFLFQDWHRLLVDVDGSTAIVRVLQKLHVGQFATGYGRLHLHPAVVRIYLAACVRAVYVLPFWFRRSYWLRLWLGLRLRRH